MRIQHNIMALNAYRQLGGNNSALAKNLEKLSSGYRINRAGDDAAGLAISEKMRAQIKGLEAAQKNANDGISLVQTAEGALTEVHSMLNRMVYLATQSANGTYDNEVDRANLDKEVQTLKDEIDRISKSTNFNGLNLLDGSIDAATTKTTGGKTDVPILQNEATDPTKEVGTATVLHEDAPKPGPTEINVELHNVKVTSKSKVGDSISFKVGDAEVELKIGQAEDLANGVLEAGKTYDSTAIANAIKQKFDAGDKLIGGQEFNVTVSGNTLKFTQAATPKDKTEVVNANVGVSIDYVENPDGNPKEYTVKIADTLAEGAKIKIGGNEVTLTDKLSVHFATATKVGDYEVTYEDGTLKVKDPNGTLKTPTVSYDSYETALTQKPSESKDAAAVVTGAAATTTIELDADVAAGDEVTIDGSTFKLDDAGTWVLQGDGATSDYVVTTNATDSKKIDISRAADKNAADANGKVATYKPKANAMATGSDNKLTAGVAGANDGTEKAKATITLDRTPAENDVIQIGNSVYKYNGTAWAHESGDDLFTLAENGADDTKVDIESKAEYTQASGITFTGAITGIVDNPAMANGETKVDAAKAEASFDLSSLEEGDKLIIGSEEFIIGEDGLAGLTQADILAAAKAADNTVASVVIDSDSGKITFQTADSAANTPRTAPDVTLKVAKKVTKDGEVVTPADAKSMDGTWNVQSTKNKQGAAEGGGQLASTTFDLTTDIVADGNVLTIGDASYIFKVGKDSTVSSQAGQTLIDLSDIEADDPELINKAGAKLANAANNAFTIGYEKDSKKISIHEIEGQTAFTNGELESIEEFDKLVYMTAPEKTETTGKSLTFQVGDTADDFQKVELSIHDMSSEGLGIADVSIGTIDDATSAIAKIKDAINTVSSQRGDLGAIQNRLEHTINNLGVQTENITAAESRIRDTDMAEEMMAYTKNNILVQAAQAMLAQANQVPQGILQLLQ